MKSFLNKLLDYYHISLEDYLKLTKEPSIEDIPTLDSFNNGKITKDLLQKHLDKNDNIAIYGDYDCDGIMATSILVFALNKIGYKNYTYYIPSRYSDGYGITLDFVKSCLKNNVKLIITVDNGISANEPINFAIESGIDVIIADHHEPLSVLPNTPYVIHPFYSKNPDLICSGGFTSFIVSTMILNEADPYLLSLAGISTISDMMSLTGYNRDVVRLAIKIINKNKYAPIIYLAQNKEIDEYIIGSLIAPKINSVGRIIEDNNINKLVSFFVSDDKSLIDELGNKINNVNELRKNISRDVNISLEEFKNKNAIVIKCSEKEGIIGLLANKFLNETNKLSIVFTDACEDQILKGSARSREGISLIELFENTSNYLLRSGGHANAAGLSIKDSDFDNFKKAVYSYTKEKNFITKQEEFIKISPIEVNIENYNTLFNFGPFGMDNPKPKFIIKDFPSKSIAFSKDGKHILTTLSNEAKLVMFNVKNRDVLKNTLLSLVGTFSLNEYKGYISVNFIISDIY